MIDKARSYLASALKAGGVTLKEASLALGRNHAYLQQYVRQGKPRWLSEEDRNLLSDLYGLDTGRLAPPPKSPNWRKRQDGREIEPPNNRELADDSRTLELLKVWAALDGAKRSLVLSVARNLRGTALVAAAA